MNFCMSGQVDLVVGLVLVLVVLEKRFGCDLVNSGLIMGSGLWPCWSGQVLLTFGPDSVASV